MELHGKLIVAVLLVVGITFSMYQPGQPMMRVKPIVKRLVKQPLRYISDNYFKNHIIRVDNWRDLSWEELSEVVPFQGRKHAPKESYFLMTGNEIKALEREEVEKQPIYKEAKEKNRNAVFTSGGLYKQVDTYKDTNGEIVTEDKGENHINYGVKCEKDSCGILEIYHGHFGKKGDKDEM